MSAHEKPPVRRLLIVWHSRTGAARQLARAARDGALDAIQELEAGANVEVVLRAAAQASAHDILCADAYLFCAPENLGTLSGTMKEFFDRSYYGVGDRVAGRPYALAIAAGSDGGGAVRQVERICTGWRMRAAAPAFIAHTDAQTPEAILAPKKLDDTQREQARVLGGTLAAMIC